MPDPVNMMRFSWPAGASAIVDDDAAITSADPAVVRARTGLVGDASTG
jgi:hypothetical protein